MRKSDSYSRSEKMFFGGLIGFFVICIGLSIQALMSLQHGIAPLPEKYISTQTIHQAVSDAQIALQKAHLSQTHDDVYQNLADFRANIDKVRQDTPESFQVSLPDDDQQVRSLLKNHADLTVRLNTYLYVIDNAHKEFQDILSEQADKAYLDLVMETDRSQSIPGIINNFVTPLVSTTQLGTDVNYIVANLEKAGSANQKSAVIELIKGSDNALKRINAAFSLHKDDPSFQKVEDITFQIVSFAHGPNNIFEIRQTLLGLNEQLIRVLEQYDLAFIDIYRYSNTLRAEYAGILYQEISQTQNAILIILGLNILIFIGSAVGFAILTHKQKAANASQSEVKQPQIELDRKTENQSFLKRKSYLVLIAALDNIKVRTKHAYDCLRSIIQLKQTNSDISLDDKYAHNPQEQDNKDLISSQRSYSEILDKNETYTQDSKQDTSQDEIRPLLLDTNMRIDAQRQKLKKALSELDDSHSARSKELKTQPIDDVLNMLNETEQNNGSETNAQLAAQKAYKK